MKKKSCSWQDLPCLGVGRWATNGRAITFRTAISPAERDSLRAALADWREKGSCLDWYPGMDQSNLIAADMDYDKLEPGYLPQEVSWAGFSRKRKNALSGKGGTS